MAPTARLVMAGFLALLGIHEALCAPGSVLDEELKLLVNTTVDLQQLRFSHLLSKGLQTNGVIEPAVSCTGGGCAR